MILEPTALEPTAIVLCVDNLAISSQFYQDLLGIKPEEASPTFHSFTLSNGMGLGLKTKHAVEPLADKNGGGELAFTLDNNKNVDALFAEWQEKDINIGSCSNGRALWLYFCRDSRLNPMPA